MLTNVKAEVGLEMAQLGFMKDINPDGTIIDEESVNTQIAKAIDEVLVPASDGVAA